uniref:REM-1 domain-containing protein n=1 Tax=Xiphophorus couchianus TaxID=32473 RepID=A0A3B5MD94_9TELE
MEDKRDIQTSRRHGSSKSVLSAGSAMAMEIKRKKMRESSFFLQKESTNIEEKVQFETRMREGAYKLLLACSKREQVLNASKNLLTCNARIKAYLAQLQREEGERDRGRSPCPGTVAVTGLRFPLIWRDSDHFSNRGSSRRVAVFCLMQIGSEVFDTEMVVADRSVTDICFEGLTVFKDVVPQFELKVELWSCSMEEELTLPNTPKKLAKKLRNSFGRSSGKKLCSLLDTPDPDTFLLDNPIPLGAKYSLLACTTLGLPDADSSFQSHSLIVYQGAEWSSWLPLYGNLCCRLVAQPACMTQSAMSGYLSQKQSVQGVNRCCNLYCLLSAGFLSCYFTPEEIDAKVQPTLNVPINNETRICVLDKQSGDRKSKSLSIINPSPEGSQSVVFTADTREELEEWIDCLNQHLYDQSQWLHCCDRLMKIEVASPRKPSLFLAKQADSVYNDLSINSPNKFESITDIIHSKIEETDGRFLIGQEEEREAPNWSSLFDGSHSVVVEKSLLSQSRTSTPCSSPSTGSTPLGNKKRRAPPPPSDVKPFANPTPVRSKTGRPSLDVKFSAIIQQLQRNNAGGVVAPSRKNAPLAVLDVQPQGPPQPSLQQFDIQNHSVQMPEDAADDVFVRAYSGPGPGPGSGPIPAPRSKLRKSLRERMNLKAL